MPNEQTFTTQRDLLFTELLDAAATLNTEQGEKKQRLRVKSSAH